MSENPGFRAMLYLTAGNVLFPMKVRTFDWTLSHQRAWLVAIPRIVSRVVSVGGPRFPKTGRYAVQLSLITGAPDLLLPAKRWVNRYIPRLMHERIFKGSGNRPGQAAANYTASTLPGGNFKCLSDAWADSSAFGSLAPRTRRDYLAAKAKIDSRWGAHSLAEIESAKIRPIFLDWRDEMGKQSLRQADAVFGILRLMLEWGRNRGLISQNHATRPKKLYRSNRSEKVWRTEQLNAFRLKASPEMRLALELALWTGQRQSDLLRLPWSSYDGHRLTLRQSKRGRKIDMPVAAPLRSLLDNLERTDSTILTAPNGRPWRTEPRPTHFQHIWRRTTLAAGLDGLHFHDLRGTTCTALAEAGATSSEIAAMLGWTLSSVNQMLDTYQAMTASLSDSAVNKLEAYSGRGSLELTQRLEERTNS